MTDVSVSLRSPAKRAKEIMNITETPDGNAVLLVSDDVSALASKEEDDPFSSIIWGGLVLARDQIVSDAQKIEMGDDRRIGISPDPEHENVVSVVRILMTDEGKFQTLVYFGGKASRTISLRAGLIHAAEMLAVVQENLFSKP